MESSEPARSDCFRNCNNNIFFPSVEGEQEGTESNLSDEIPASVLYSSEFCNLYVASTKISPKPIYIGVRSQHTDM